MRTMTRTEVSLLLLSMSASAAVVAEPVKEVEETGCTIEQFAVQPGTNEYQYDGFSADGQQLIVGWDRGEEVRGTYVLNLQTGGRTELEGLNNVASFSPDGKFVVGAIYEDSGKTDIAIYDIESGDVSIVALDAEWDWLPSFSPDGQSILFNSYRTGNSDIYLLDLQTQQLRRLTNSENYEAHAQFSPSGEHIVYNEQVSDVDFNIKVIDLASGDIVEITSESSEEGYPSWSPDGAYIVFASDRYQTPGVSDIFVMSKSGEVVSRITDSPSKKGYPFWSPDGQYVYFNYYGEPPGIYRVAMTNTYECERG